MLSKHGAKSGKAQLHGRHKPKMLADDLRRNAPKKADKKPKAKFIPQDINQLQPFINIDLSKLSISWPLIIIMLILIPGALANPNILRVIIEGMSVNGQSVELLPPDIYCRPNTGNSHGVICQFDGAEHYLKLFKPEPGNAQLRAAGDYVSYEAYNSEFVKNNIGTQVPEVKFYKKSPAEKEIYKASKRIDGLMFTGRKTASNEQLGNAGVAKWAVASTFIFDLHPNNVGYANNELMMLDLDGYIERPSKSFLENLINAAFSIYVTSPELSLLDLDQMIEIYREMQKKPLPKYHDELNTTEKMYQRLLQKFITISENTKLWITNNRREIAPTERTIAINRAWCEFVKMELSEKDLKTNYYQALCVENVLRHTARP